MSPLILPVACLLALDGLAKADHRTPEQQVSWLVAQEAKRRAATDWGAPPKASVGKLPKVGIKTAVASDPRFAEFRGAWPDSQRKGDRTGDLVRYWQQYGVSRSPRFEHTMKALADKKACKDWNATDKDVIPTPAAWINGQPWLPAELAQVEPIVIDAQDAKDLVKYLGGKESWGPEKLWGVWCEAFNKAKGAALVDEEFIKVHKQQGKEAAARVFAQAVRRHLEAVS